jgi:hypothetical protein
MIVTAVILGFIAIAAFVINIAAFVIHKERAEARHVRIRGCGP